MSVLLNPWSPRGWLGPLALLACSGCANPTLAWAPRLPGPPRPARDPDLARVIELGKPSCPYEVIGTAFGGSLEEMKVTAAAHGGDGIYDTSCMVTMRNTMASARCDGRVFVCKGPSPAAEKAP